jgi:hypothetical protein
MNDMKLLTNGCMEQLAYITMTSRNNNNLASNLVVHEFAIVFPNELPTLPQSQEMEFKISLLSSMNHTSVTPH